MSIRKTVFWLHLAAGLTAGLIVVVMSATGIALAFEREILQWIDRDVRYVTAPAGTPRMTLDQLDSAVNAQYPDFKTTARTIPRAPNAAYEFRAGRDGTLYVNPYTGTANEPKSKAMHDALRLVVAWHRYLGMDGDGRAVGKLITGIANLAFLFICISGVYMWWPRSWSPKAWRPAVWFVGRIKGRARDFNWHNVFGCWSALVLIVIVAGGVMISFQWANRLVFRMAGEEPPARGQNQAPALGVPLSTERAPMTRDALLAAVARRYPDWQSISFDATSLSKETNSIAALNVTVLEPASFQARGRTQLSIDPYRGEILRKISFDDRSAGTRARTWLRFLHTGEAFGFVGKVVAAIATFASLFLAYTGFALSYRRFFPRKASTIERHATPSRA